MAARHAQGTTSVPTPGIDLSAIYVIHRMKYRRRVGPDILTHDSGRYPVPGRKRPCIPYLNPRADALGKLQDGRDGGKHPGTTFSLPNSLNLSSPPPPHQQPSLNILCWPPRN